MNISVIIPAYNSEKVIGRCIESLLNQSVMPDEIIVVDGNSTDKTKEICRSFNKSIVRLVINEKNHYPGTNRNLGVMCAKNNQLVFIDSDCIADENLIKIYKKEFGKNSIIAGNVKVFNPGKISNIGYIMQAFFLPRENGFIKRNFFWVMNFGITKEKYIDFPDYPMASEDIVFAQNLTRKEKNIFFNEDIIVHHSYPDNFLDFFCKQLNYAKRFVDVKEEMDKPAPKSAFGIVLSLMKKNTSELEKNIYKKSISYDEQKNMIVFRKSPKTEIKDILCLALTVAAFEKKGGKLNMSYQNLIELYQKD
jgi:glycosyltransferase involved in cell wall biosynthesis